MKNVNLRIPLTGSLLFDTNQRYIARVVVERFHELTLVEERGDNCLYIVGDLSDDRYEDWHQLVFQRDKLWEDIACG